MQDSFQPAGKLLAKPLPRGGEQRWRTGLAKNSERNGGMPVARQLGQASSLLRRLDTVRA